MLKQLRPDGAELRVVREIQSGPTSGVGTLLVPTTGVGLTLALSNARSSPAPPELFEHVLSARVSGPLTYTKKLTGRS